MNKDINTILCSLSLLLLMLIACKANKTTSHKSTSQSLRPNIVLIMADDLGYAGISCFGDKFINTPNLDQLSSEGIMFTDFHSNGVVCSPTRAALMTGKYQQRTGVNGVITAASHREVGLNINEVTIADELKKHNYNCGIFGKWHLGYSQKYNPRFQGFDKYVGFVSGNIDYHAHIDQEGYLDWWRDTTINNEEGYTTDLITKYGTSFIEEYDPKKTGKPFFLYLPHEAPHSPFQKRIDKILRKVGTPETNIVSVDSIPIIYKEMVEVMDAGIGKIMQTLRKKELDKNTIILFCSDNGANKYGNNGQLRGTKGSVYEGGHRVPAIAWYPGVFKQGIKSQQTVLTMDLLPTFLDIINEKPSDQNIDGISIKNLLFSEAKIPDRDLFWKFKNASTIRRGDMKLVLTMTKNIEIIELYNLAEDINERDDLSQKYPELTLQLKKVLIEWDKEVHEGIEVVSK